MSRRRSASRPASGRPRQAVADKAAAAKDRSANALLAEGVAHHQQGRLGEAEAIYRRALSRSPNQADALHLLGVIAHQRGGHEKARDLVRRAIAVDADNALYHNTLGTVALATGDMTTALACLRRALALNPGYVEAHNNLGNALQRSGAWDDAVASYRAALRLRPGYAEAHFNLGRALHSLGDLEAAADCYRRAIGQNARYLKARKALGDATAELGRSEEAEAHYRRALELDPSDADSHAALAALWERANKLDAALAAAEAALAGDPGHVRATVIAARCERRLGRPEQGLARLERLAERTLDDDSRAFVAFETATILDRVGQFRQAFACYAEGNRAILAGAQARRIDAEAFPREIDRITATFAPDWLAGWTPAVDDEAAPPVFLVGFPRSGTTLLDQILDAHPAITALEEKPTVDTVKGAVAERPEGYPDALATLSADEIRHLRRLYWREAARHGWSQDGAAGGAAGATLVDKMPLNTIDVGLIHRLFPRARILLALRHPCDVVLSGFMQAFRPNPAMVRFATLESTAALYAQVMALWRRYAEVLPLTVMTTRYEDLVADLEGETRRILDFLQLPWDDAVLSYRKRAESRAIATPSYHQVVQPIYSRSIGRWLNYRGEMATVLPLLEPHIRAFGYDVPTG